MFPFTPSRGTVHVGLYTGFLYCAMQGSNFIWSLWVPSGAGPAMSSPEPCAPSLNRSEAKVMTVSRSLIEPGRRGTEGGPLYERCGNAVIGSGGPPGMETNQSPQITRGRAAGVSGDGSYRKSAPLQLRQQRTAPSALYPSVLPRIPHEAGKPQIAAQDDLDISWQRTLLRLRGTGKCPSYNMLAEKVRSNCALSIPQTLFTPDRKT